MNKKRENTQEELFQFTGTRVQFELIVAALDMHSRLLAGQVDTALYFPLVESNPNISDYEALRRSLVILKQVAFPQFDLNESNHYRGSSMTSFDCIQVIRNALSWSKYPEGGNGVNFSEPMMFGKEPPPYILKWEGGEAVRVRNEINRKYFLRDEFKSTVGTEDLQDALALIKKWKTAHDQWETELAKARVAFGAESYDQIIEAAKKPSAGKKFRAQDTVVITEEDLASPEKFFGKLLADPPHED